MTKTKSGLGRGLEALINPIPNEQINAPVSIANSKLLNDDGNAVDILVKIEINAILPNPYQPRSDFDPKSLEELKNSIVQNGLIQPVTVRRIDFNKYELVSGERRLRACKDLGYKDIPAYIIKVESKEAMLALALIENIQREKLNPIEIAYAYKRLIEECNLSQEQVSEKVGKDRTTITNTLRLLKLPNPIQESLIKDEISAGHARALINLYDDNLQLQILHKIKKNNLSVRKVESLVKNILEGNKVTLKNDRAKSQQELSSQKDLENKLRLLFGTKVTCKQNKNGAGEIVIEFYSNDELDRLLELFEIIEKVN